VSYTLHEHVSCANLLGYCLTPRYKDGTRKKLVEATCQATIRNFARKLEKKGGLNGGGKHLRQISEAVTEDVAGRLGQSL